MKKSKFLKSKVVGIVLRKVITIFFIFMISLVGNKVLAHQGCCSWHAGVDSCDIASDKLLCNDGTLSPTCSCDDDANNSSNDNDDQEDNDN
jgi:hypothetical protein